MLIRPTASLGVAVPVTGRPIPIYARDVVHGKNGPAPSGLPAAQYVAQAGAVLFGPFSWAYKKKDVNINK